jgi:hypothetical protein
MRYVTGMAHDVILLDEVAERGATAIDIRWRRCGRAWPAEPGAAVSGVCA